MGVPSAVPLNQQPHVCPMETPSFLELSLLGVWGGEETRRVPEGGDSAGLEGCVEEGGKEPLGGESSPCTTLVPSRTPHLPGTPTGPHDPARFSVVIIPDPSVTPLVYFE